MKSVHSMLVLMTLMTWSTIVMAHAEAPTKPRGYVYRETSTGRCSLRVHQPLETSQMTIAVVAIWHYDPDRDAWGKVTRAQTTPTTVTRKTRQIYSGATDDLVLQLPEEIGLFWVQWTEDGRAQGAFAVSGPVLCNDIAIGPQIQGDRVAACIPFPHRAVAAYVPDPHAYCK